MYTSNLNFCYSVECLKTIIPKKYLKATPIFLLSYKNSSLYETINCKNVSVLLYKL